MSLLNSKNKKGLIGLIQRTKIGLILFYRSHPTNEVKSLIYQNEALPSSYSKQKPEIHFELVQFCIIQNLLNFNELNLKNYIACHYFRITTYNNI